MTPERLTGLAALLLEVRDWMQETDQNTFDVHFLELTVDLLGALRRRLVEDGAR